MAMTVLEVLQPAIGQASKVAAFAHRRILVVDDKVDAADSLGYLVEVSGHEFAMPMTGRPGLRWQGSFSPTWC